MPIKDILDNKRNIDFDLEGDDLEFKRVDYDWGSDIGLFKKDTTTLHGIGRSVWKNGPIIEGMFREDRLNGYGRLLRDDGSYYIGMVKDGERFGRGKHVWADGTVEEGYYY